MSVLEVVHPLAVGAQAAARPAHRVGDEDRHLRVAAVDVVRGQHPPGRVRLAGLDDVLLLPRHDRPELLHEVLAVEQVAADRLVGAGMLLLVPGPHVHEGEEVGRGEHGDALGAGFGDGRGGRGYVPHFAVDFGGAFAI